MPGPDETVLYWCRLTTRVPDCCRTGLTQCCTPTDWTVVQLMDIMAESTFWTNNCPETFQQSAVTHFDGRGHSLWEDHETTGENTTRPPLVI